MQADTAKRILQTAKALIADRGYAGFSYADIAETIQIRKASIHHHFPTKAELVVAVLRWHREQFLAGTQHLSESFSDPRARLSAYVQYWEGCIRDKSQPFCIAALLAAELPSLPPEVQAEVHLHFQALGDWIRQTLEEGLSRHTLTLRNSADAESQMFMAAVHGAMLSARALNSCAVFHSVTATALERIAA